MAAGAACTSSFVRPDFTERGWSSALHPATALVSCLWTNNHFSTSAVHASTDQHEVARQLGAAQVEVEAAGGDRLERIAAAGRPPGSPVPHDHVAAAVLTHGDHALEVEEVERMILDAHRHPAHVGVERRPLRHRPAEEHAARLEPEVVVQPSRTMALHDEPASGRRRR